MKPFPAGYRFEKSDMWDITSLLPCPNCFILIENYIGFRKKPSEELKLSSKIIYNKFTMGYFSFDYASERIKAVKYGSMKIIESTIINEADIVIKDLP